VNELRDLRAHSSEYLCGRRTFRDEGRDLTQSRLFLRKTMKVLARLTVRDRSSHEIGEFSETILDTVGERSVG